MRRRTIAPIRDLAGFDPGVVIDRRFELGEGTSLCLLADCPVPEEQSRRLGLSEKEDLRRCRYALLVEYEADTTRERDPTWHGPTPRSKEETAIFRIRMANYALWLTRPTGFGFTASFHQMETERGFEGTGFQTDWPASVVPLPNYERSALTASDLEEARARFQVLVQMPQEGPVWLAVYALSKAIPDREWIGRFLLI